MNGKFTIKVLVAVNIQDFEEFS